MDRTSTPPANVGRDPQHGHFHIESKRLKSVRRRVQDAYSSSGVATGIPREDQKYGRRCHGLGTLPSPHPLWESLTDSGWGLGRLGRMEERRLVASDEAWAWMEPLLPFSAGEAGGGVTTGR